MPLLLPWKSKQDWPQRKLKRRGNKPKSKLKSKKKSMLKKLLKLKKRLLVKRSSRLREKQKP
jgi:hypothetical protein